VDVLITGALAGLALAIPLGPMAILLISTTLKHGRGIGVFGALAMASVDLSYAALVFAFGNVIINLLTGWVLPLRLLGSAILVYVAVKIFIDARKSSSIENPDLSDSPASRFKTYAKFFGLTVLNPATAFYFFGITPSVAALSQGTGFWSIGLFALGVFVGSGVWQMGLVVAAHLTKSFTDVKVQHRIQYVGAGLILALAVGLLLK
jgi:threonine/homoserine/homoserine lactone efflux protein